MGKKIFATLIVAVVATFAGYNIYQSQRAKNTMSELAMANVEALADINETDSSGQTLYCCGNEDTCAKGEDEDTGEELSFMVYYLVKNVNKIDVIYEKIYICVLFCFFDYCRFGIKGKDKE